MNLLPAQAVGDRRRRRAAGRRRPAAARRRRRAGARHRPAAGSVRTAGVRPEALRLAADGRPTASAPRSSTSSTSATRPSCTSPPAAIAPHRPPRRACSTSPPAMPSASPSTPPASISLPRTAPPCPDRTRRGASRAHSPLQSWLRARPILPTAPSPTSPDPTLDVAGSNPIAALSSAAPAQSASGGTAAGRQGVWGVPQNLAAIDSRPPPASPC